MAGSPHYRELLLALNASGGEYMVAGGYALMRSDISTHIDGVDFEGAWCGRVQGVLFGAPESFLSLAESG